MDIRTIPAIIGGNRKDPPRHCSGKVSAGEKQVSYSHRRACCKCPEKCPTLTIIPPDHDSYSRHSKQFVGFLRSLTPEIEQVSVDECFLDYTTIASCFLPRKRALLISATIFMNTLVFTVNVGISSNKVLAKSGF